MRSAIRTSSILRRPCMDVMNFLNEAASTFPHAISLAAGQPPQQFVSAQQSSTWIARFVKEQGHALHKSEADIWRCLGQYGATNGMIAEQIVRYLRVDEGLVVDPRSIMVTNGMQEAAMVLLLGLFEGDDEVLLCDDPAYVGIVGAASLARVEVQALAGKGSIVERTERALATLARAGGRARALYVVPDFSNPLGTTLSLEERRDLIVLAQRASLLIIEDTTYRAFRYEGHALPTLKSLDTEGTVVQLGSFSKLFMPGPRVGYLNADSLMTCFGAAARPLTQELSKIKSFVSVLTSPVAQALVGGFLMTQDYSLHNWNAPRVAACRANRDALLESLGKHGARSLHLRGFNRPAGGFFLSLELSSAFEAEDVLRCAEQHGVIVCPMSFFTSAPEYRKFVRLSFSNVSENEIEAGVERLLGYLNARALPLARPARNPA